MVSSTGQLRQRVWTLAGIAVVGLGVAGGCSSALETGYKPTPLGAPAAARRAYYANPFTPEAQGQVEQAQQPDIYRPHGY